LHAVILAPLGVMGWGAHFSPSPHARKDEGDEQDRSCCRFNGLGDGAGMHRRSADGHAGRLSDADGDFGRSGDIAECSQDNNAQATAALLAKIPGTVLALGDNAYPDGTRTQYANCYDNYRLSDGSTFDTCTSWWGQYKARTMPVVGNHEYHISKVAQPYFDYFSAINGFKQPRATVPNTSANPG
jgi:hypothetical protein